MLVMQKAENFYESVQKVGFFKNPFIEKDGRGR